MNRFASLAVASAVALASSATAAPIVSDSYLTGANPAGGEYVAGASIAAQPGLTNTGFAANGYTGGIGTSNFVANSNGLDSAFTDGEAGGCVQWLGAGRDGVNRSVARNLSPAFDTTSRTFYSSVIVNRGTLTTVAGADSFIGVGFSNTTVPALGATSGNLFGFYLGFSGSAGASPGTNDNFGSLVIRSRNAASATAADTVIVDGTVSSTFSTNYLVIVKSLANVGGSADSLVYWVNPTDVSSDAAMTASSLATGTINGFMYGGTTSDFTRVTYFDRNWDGTAYFDELRVGNALSDVATAPIPEPGLLSLVPIAGAALARRRR